MIFVVKKRTNAISERSKGRGLVRCRRKKLTPWLLWNWERTAKNSSNFEDRIPGQGYYSSIDRWKRKHEANPIHTTNLTRHVTQNFVGKHRHEQSSFYIHTNALFFEQNSFYTYQWCSFLYSSLRWCRKSSRSPALLLLRLLSGPRRRVSASSVVAVVTSSTTSPSSPVSKGTPCRGSAPRKFCFQKSDLQQYLKIIWVFMIITLLAESSNDWEGMLVVVGKWLNSSSFYLLL